MSDWASPVDTHWPWAHLSPLMSITHPSAAKTMARQSIEPFMGPLPSLMEHLDHLRLIALTVRQKPAQLFACLFLVRIESGTLEALHA
jgi:hypothetical protein